MACTKAFYPLVTLGAALLLTASVAAADPTSFDQALAAAKANVETPEGEKYDTDFGKQFGERYVDTMVRCTTGVAEADFARFDLLIRVSRDGSVEGALVQPNTKVASCLRREVVKGKFLRPPRGSYWVRIEMSLTP